MVSVLFHAAASYYSIENLLLNYLIYASIVGVFAVVMAVVAHKTEGLGPVIGGFFSVKSAKVQDAMTLVEDSVDALVADQAGAKASGLSASKTASNDAYTTSVSADIVTANTTRVDASAGAKAAKVAAQTKGAQAAPQSIDAEDIVFLKGLLKKHKANNVDAWAYLATSFVLWCGGMYCMHFHTAWWSVLFVGGMNVRLFIIFHDACHNSFFPSSKRNHVLASCLQAIVGQNMSDWTKSHNHHHRHLGRVDISDFSLTVWFTEAEYHSMTPVLKFAYRLIRDPLVLPNLLSWFIFWLFPILKDPVKTLSIRGCFYAPIVYIFGWHTAMLYVLTVWIGGVVGIQLFHLQHQCNDVAYRVTAAMHSKWDAGMIGSTHLLVPWPLTMMTAGIEFHHIHHASTQVPSYHLAACHYEGEAHRREGKGDAGFWDRAGVNRVGMKRAFLSLFHTLFEGDVKHSHDKNSPPPRFRAFDFYRWLGLEDIQDNKKKLT